MKPCSRCGVEDRYPGQRWGPRCMGTYVAIRRRAARQATATASRAEIPPVEASISRPRPADLPSAVLELLGPEERETYQRYVLGQTASTDMLKHLLRFGLEAVRMKGYVRDMYVNHGVNHRVTAWGS